MDARSMLAEAREETDKLFALVKPEAIYDRPIAERHRIVFYLGHLEAFDWNLLRPGMKTEPFDAHFDRLFAFGIDPVDGGLPQDVPADWPAIAEIAGYNREVRRRVDDAEHDGMLLHMALEHRLMHAETLAYMLHQLPLVRKLAEGQAQVGAGESARGMIEIPGGCATLGMARTGAYGWDNEFEAHRVAVPAFAIDRCKVTNARYMEFVDAGGYRDASLWTPAAWEWKEAQNIEHPVFWRREAGRWRWRTMFDEIALPPHWPVYVSHAEASAYAEWAGLRLPTEAEWHRAAYAAENGGERQYPWGDDAPSERHGYFGFARWDPAPVSAFADGRSAFGVEGMLANGWEWTSSEFAPFGGFKEHPSYAGYSANFFDGKHFVLKGGSARTAACMLRRSFRNWFQPHYQYVYAGFRCVKGA